MRSAGSIVSVVVSLTSHAAADDTCNRPEDIERCLGRMACEADGQCIERCYQQKTCAASDRPKIEPRLVETEVSRLSIRPWGAFRTAEGFEVRLDGRTLQPVEDGTYVIEAGAHVATVLASGATFHLQFHARPDHSIQLNPDADWDDDYRTANRLSGVYSLRRAYFIESGIGLNGAVLGGGYLHGDERRSPKLEARLSGLESGRPDVQVAAAYGWRFPRVRHDRVLRAGLSMGWDSELGAKGLVVIPAPFFEAEVRRRMSRRLALGIVARGGYNPNALIWGDQRGMELSVAVSFQIGRFDYVDPLPGRRPKDVAAFRSLSSLALSDRHWR